ncbi:alpha/beta fold hydrolase [Aliiroseovarius crassostreae]|uniref:alpha/beta fold hydrolase n=1 Tax=Aliiroseovarius crassostreae TaxID=154981 RepID=UPI00220A0138|nr:alpha/beta hydrolase [Aliiroseovarius crassostreae]UWP89952.1 alpha/beta hydrolase [Aliiroseovarius crassostreae]
MREPLVLVPGMVCDARVFAPQINVLSRKYSVQLANLAMGDTIREMAAHVLDQAPPRFALAGHSMGGIVAMEVTRRAPERVSRLALLSTSPLPDTPAQAAWREPLIVRAQAGRLAEAVSEVVTPDTLAPGDGQDAILSLIRDMALDFGPEMFIRHQRALQRRPDAQRMLQKLKIPTMVLCGAHDRLTSPRRHENMAELVVGAELVVLPNAGHMPMLECPEEVTIGLDAWMQMPLALR